jgi:hypothetical protein
LIELAPVPRAALDNGALKAVVIRFLAPLYAALGVVAAAQGRIEVAIELAPIALLVALLAARLVWPACVNDLPLSTPPEDVVVDHRWGNLLLTLGIVAAILAALATMLVTSSLRSLAVIALLAACELGFDRAWRRQAAD